MRRNLRCAVVLIPPLLSSVASAQPSREPAPCEEVIRNADRAVSDSSRTLLAISQHITPACRTAVEERAAPPALHDLLVEAQEFLAWGEDEPFYERPPPPERRRGSLVVGLLCISRPSWATGPMMRALSDRGVEVLDHRTVGLCLAGLSTVADRQAQAAVDDYIARNGRSVDSLDPTLLDAIEHRYVTPELRRRLPALLRLATRRRTSGRDLLWVELCSPGAETAADPACSPAGPLQEPGWRRDAEARSRSYGRREFLRKAAGLTFALGFAGGLSYLTRDQEYVGRTVATASGAFAGMSVGAPLGIAVTGRSRSPMSNMMVAALWALPASLVGSLIAFKTSSDPGTDRFATSAIGFGITIGVVTVMAW